MSEYSSNIQSHDTYDSLASVFEPDLMLPSQFLLPDEQGLGGGERRLMAALLSDGIEAYIAQSMSLIAQGEEESRLGSPRGKSDACEWVEIKDESYVFSFDNVCESLGINPEYLRIGLARYIEAARRLRAEARKEGSGERSAWKKIRRPRKQ